MRQRPGIIDKRQTQQEFVRPISARIADLLEPPGVDQLVDGRTVPLSQEGEAVESLSLTKVTSNRTVQGALFDEHALSTFLDVRVRTIRHWRLLNEGPPFIKLHNLVRYRVRDVEAWLQSRRRGGERIAG